MYKILAGDNVVYDSTNKYDYPCIEPVLNLELGEAGNLEFTLLPGHPMHDAIEEMQTFVTAYQDDDVLLDGRVLQAEEDTFGQVRCTCEGALTFLLDSEMEPGTYTETMAEFFARCINEHNKQVESRKHFSIGNIDHEEKDVKLEFKLEGYNKTREVLNNLLISKHGGFLQVRYENGQRYLDYIQHYTKTTNQPIKIGYNVIDKTKHVSGENLFTILRPLGKNNLTIEGASSENLMEGASIVNGKYLGETGGDRVTPNNDWMYSANFISVSPGTTYIYGPGEMRILCYDENKHYMTTLEPGNAYEVTIPLTVEGFENEIAYARLAYNKAYNSKIVFKEPGNSLIDGASGVQGKILTHTDSGIDNPDYAAEDGAYDAWDNYEELEPVEIILQNRERVQDAEGWNYDSTIFSVSAGSQYLATPGLVSANFYKLDKDGNYECFDMYRSTDNIGGDIFTVPAEASGMRLSYSNRFGSAMRVELYSGDNFASPLSGTSGKLIGCKKDNEEDDSEWCYTSNYIRVEENTYYTGGPSQIKVCFYDEGKLYISSEEANREGLTMHYVRSPHGAKYARISFLAKYAGEQQFQKGKALILTKLDKGTKTILLPERIARYGQIIHSESFGDITDPQELYNAAIEWVSLHHSMLPASLDYGIVDFHLLNPDIEMFELGDVYDNIEGFEDEALTIGSLSKNMENPANDTLTLKNLAELMGPDAGKSSGSLSSKYAASSSGGGSGGNSGGSGGSSEDEKEETIPKDILLKSLETIGIEAPYIRLLAEERDGLKAQIDLIAKGKDGNQSSISLTDSAVDINSENIILEAKNLYNIADNVVTIADTVFTHANLIWNEAKDIVTIAENMYILTDHLTVVADTIDIIANDINILARNIRITADRIEIKAREIETTVSERFTVMAGRVNTLENGAKIIFGSSLNITPEQAALANGILYLDENGILHIKYGSGIRMNGPNDTDWGVYLDDVIQAGGLIKRIEQENGQTLEAKFGTFTAGQIDAGALIRRISDDANDTMRWKAAFGTMTNGVLDGGAVVDKINDLKNGTSAQQAKFGTFQDGIMDAGLMVTKITGDNSSTNYEVKLGTYVKGQITGGIIVEKLNDNSTTTKILGDRVDVRATDLATWGVYTNDTLTGGIIVEKLNDNSTTTKILGDRVDIRATDLAIWGVYTGDTLTAGVIAEKLTGKSQGNKTALRLLGDEIDIRGNTFITGILDVSKYVASGDFVIRDGVKFGLSDSSGGTSNVSLANTIGNAVVSGSFSTSNHKTTLTFTKAGGGTFQLGPFESGTAIDGIAVSQTGQAIYDSANVALKADFKLSTYTVNGDTGAEEDSGYLETKSISIPATEAIKKGWEWAGNAIHMPSAGTGTSFDITLPGSAFGDSPETKTFVITKGATPASSGYAAVSLSGTVVGRIEIGDWYTAGRNSVTQRTANQIGTVLLSRSDTGSSISKTATVFYDDNSTTSSVPITISGADLVYSQGYSDGSSSVSQRSVRSLSQITLTSSNTGTSLKATDVTYTDGNTGMAYVNVDASNVYAAGIASVSQRTANYIAAGSNLSLDSSGKFLSGTASVYYDNQTVTSGVTLEVNATSAYNAGYNAGWNACREAATNIDVVRNSEAIYNGTMYIKQATDYIAMGTGQWRLGGFTATAYILPQAKT